jgi:hypothetical protein
MNYSVGIKWFNYFRAIVVRVEARALVQRLLIGGYKIFG